MVTGAFYGECLRSQMFTLSTHVQVQSHVPLLGVSIAVEGTFLEISTIKSWFLSNRHAGGKKLLSKNVEDIF